MGTTGRNQPLIATTVKPPQEAILKAVGVDAEKFREGRTRLL